MTGRKRAVVQFLVAAVMLAVAERRRRRTTENRPEWRSPWTLGGVVFGVATHWLTDTDELARRTNRRQRVALVASQSVGQRLVFSGRSKAKREFGLGQLAGLALYRLWYGVLRPVPRSDE